MRKFGKSEIEYFEFQLEGDETVYRIPYAAHMPYSMLQTINEASKTEKRFTVQVDMLRKYMGDIVDELTTETLSEILTAWGEESMATGASVGES